MITTIQIRIPPATDIADLTGTYGSLLTSIGIPNQLGVTSGQFSHPIEESRMMLHEQFQRHFHELTAIKHRHPSLRVINAQSNNELMILTLQSL